MYVQIQDLPQFEVGYFVETDDPTLVRVPQDPAAYCLLHLYHSRLRHHL